MNWTTAVVTTVMAILLVLAFAFVVVNRASEKIVTAAVPLALGAILAIGLVVFFAREEPQTRTFPVSFLYQRADKIPIAMPWRPFPWETLGFVDELRQTNPNALQDDPFVVYHEFLQKSLVDWIAHRHFGTWRVELLRFRGGGEHWGPIPDEPAETSIILSPDQVQQLLGTNRFAPFHSGPGTLALPPGTVLSVDTPKTSGAPGTIRLENWLCEITIRTSPSSGQSGIQGYALLLGFPFWSTVGNEFQTQQYIVRVRATFSRLFVGHPKMAAHKRWATNFLDGLQDAFDEQRIWDRTVENYTLRQHVSPAALPPIPFGPVRAPQRPPAPANPRKADSPPK